MIRKLALVLSTSVALTGAAMAADLPSRVAPPVYVPPAVPAFTWSGLYIGGNVGYGGDRFNYPLTAGPVAGSVSLTSSGVLGGGQVGYNFALGNGIGLGLGGTGLVAGVEADFDAADISGRLGLNLGGVASASAGSRIDYLGTARGRLGYAFGNLMVYATGGYAYARVTSSISASGVGLGALTVSKGTNQDGYVVGGGVEYAITSHLTLKTEYLRAELGAAQLIGATVGGVPVSLRERPSLNIVRAGLNYKFDLFGAPAPVVARY